MTDNDIWTVKAALEWTEGYLARKGDENPRLSAEWLLGEACGMRRIELYTCFERPLSMDERDVLRDYVARRGKGEPLQYITGEVAFRHIAVKVRPGVLIPRPETEVLVSEALALLPGADRPRALDSRMTEAETQELLAAMAAEGEDGEASSLEPGGATPAGVAADGASPADEAPAPARPSPLFVADLCTGSGCIACSIAYEHPRARVIATDIAPEAVALARENAEALEVADRVSVVQCDLGEGVPASALGRLDLVVSNPPYVPMHVLADVPREVAAFEPALALDGGADGLDVFRRLLEFCARALKPDGGFAFELHETSLDDAARLAAGAGFKDVRSVTDLAGRPRVLTGRRA
ncbi:HemK/PrmC family methyltransferase [Gordonibacter sp. 28C]|uniref:N5-glutamine methyltransferase family protein n=1 Tax=Gordonibacter sp. 28C TaxID=2078569 RepID=UPI001F546950|nr:HemK/PrmC family methyltransferase [Gordonibacter sp. 28C]